MTDERTARQANVDGAGDMNTRHLMGLTRLGKPAAHECRITEPHRKVLGRVSSHEVPPRPIETNLE